MAVECQNAYLDLLVAAVSGGLDTAFPRNFVADRRYGQGRRDYPVIASSLRTMVGPSRLANVRDLILAIVEDRVPGDLVEVGTWRGGVVLVMAGCLRALEPHSDRNVFGFDAFRGVEPSLLEVAAIKMACRAFPILPEATRRGIVASALRAAGFTARALDDTFLEDFTTFIRKMPWSSKRRMSVAAAAEVKEAIHRYGLSERISLVEGDIAETLPEKAPERIALLRLDVDFFEATRHALSALYGRLSPGGFCVVDDYGAIDVCRRAVDEFREGDQVDAELVWVDQECIYWRKPGTASARETATL